ncbi:MAG TPA: galactitol-1-phosphate 5-dehydrogenase [Ruminiclostridium sp.]|nr:galactitol-1-phosphate 5-dehydrogenase [Ruminiclostridium sp.]
MKALRYLEPNKLEIQDIAKPSPKKNEVLLRVRSCGICGSDVHGYLGLTGRRTPPMTMGHEFSGEIVEVGADVKSLKAGDRVAPYPVDFCEECDMCKKGDFHLCKNKRQFGVLTVDGAFAEYICLPEKLCFRIADNVSFDVASLMEPLAVAYHGVGRAGSLKDRTVLIVGAGTIGLLALACIKMQKPSKIFVSDLSDFRLGMAKKMGADVLINSSKYELRQIIDRETGGKGVDMAFEAVGATASVKSAMSALAFGGTAVWIGNNKPLIEVNMQEIVTRELKVYGSFLYSLNDFKTVVDHLNNEELDVSEVISLNIPLEKAPDLFDKLAHDPGALIKVIVNP